MPCVCVCVKYSVCIIYPKFEKEVYVKKLKGVGELKKLLGKGVWDVLSYTPKGEKEVVSINDSRPSWTELQNTNFDKLDIGKN